MLLFRPVKRTDLDAIIKLVKTASAGLTTLPANEKYMRARINASLQAFADKNTSQSGLYFFVLENIASKRIIGTSAIDASVGHDTPFYSYKVSKVTRMSHELKTRIEYRSLSVVNDYTGASELCSLFLDAKQRKGGNGLFLSRARLLFLAQFPQRFSDLVIAELRGVSDANGISPFYQSLGAKFFNLDFATADQMTVTTNKQFMMDLMPRSHIYDVLLSKRAQAVIGRPHPHTKAAMKILLKENFHYRGYVDVFDAGPTVEANLSRIKTVRTSELCKCQVIKSPKSENDYEPVGSEKYLISNTSLQFRAVCVTAEIENKVIKLPADVTKALRIKNGDSVRVVKF